ncbi:MAG: PorT family protein [Bacteroidales bacterium]|jgi:hypothetical protein|nr:PorT family protein [Bacteroidales bacterium]
MKKNFLIVFFLLISVASFAQDGKRVAIGLTIGPSIDWISPKTQGYEKNGVSLGVRYGIPVDINFTKATNYYLSTGIKFEHTGGKLAFKHVLKEDLEEVDLERKYNALYLTIPTGVKLKTPNFGDLVFAGNFGFLHSFRLSCKNIDKWTDANGHSVTPDEKSEYNGCMFFKESLYVGVGAEYIVQEDFRASFYMNYAYTLSNFFTKKSLNYSTNLREKGNLGSVEFVFGFHF